MTMPTLHASRQTKATALGELPVEWGVTPLQKCARLERGKFAFRPRNEPRFYGGKTPFVQTGDVSNAHTWIRCYTQTLSEEGLAISKVFPKGTILMTIAANIGDCAMLDFDSACPDSLIGILPRDSVDGLFLLYTLIHRKDHLHYLAPAGAQKNLNLAFLQKIEVPVPPLPEQRRIAAVLGTWDRSLERLEKLLKAKQQFKRGLMQQLLTGKKRFKRFAGEEWKAYRLSDLFERVFRPVTLSDEAPLDLISIRRRAGGLFFRGSFTAREFKTLDLNRIETGDFLISKRQVTHGALAMVRQPFDGMHVSNEYVIFRCKAPEKLHMSFFDWLARSPRMWHMAYLASNGVHIEKLIFDAHDFLREKIAIPPSLEEQQQIVDLLEASDTEIHLLKQELTALQDQKRGMMQKLLTGRVRVRA
jgi:type I restriction enzyme S subunit